MIGIERDEKKPSSLKKTIYRFIIEQEKQIQRRLCTIKELPPNQTLDEEIHHKIRWFVRNDEENSHFQEDSRPQRVRASSTQSF